MQTGSWIAKATLALATTLITLGLLGGTGEFAARYREHHRRTPPGKMPLIFYQHRRLGHALVRDYDYFGWAHVNAQGFRAREPTAEKKGNVLRIMVVGSSTTFDPQVSGDSATWPARLETWLNRLSPDRKVEVLNAGVPGYRVIDDVIRLEMELYRYHPDLIILYEGHNDLFGTLQRARGEKAKGDTEGESSTRESSTPGEIPTVAPWTHWLTRHSLLYGKLRGRLRVISFRSRGEAVLQSRRTDTAEALVDEGANGFARDLNTFLAVARGFGFRVVVPQLVHVSGVGATEEPDPKVRQEWRNALPFAGSETVLRGYVRYNDALRRVAEQNGVSWISTQSFGLVGTKWYAEGDPIHFNDQGADRFAEQMARALSAAGVFNP